MSNQVYRSSQNKYYPQRGMSDVSLYVATLPMTTTGYQTSIPFNTIVNVPDSSNNFYYDGQSGDLLFREEGIYSVNAVVNVTAADTGAPMEIDFQLLRSDPINALLNDNIMARSMIRQPAPASAADSGVRSITLSTTAYFSAGSGVGVNFIQRNVVASPPHAIIGLDVQLSSHMWITKIA